MPSNGSRSNVFYLPLDNWNWLIQTFSRLNVIADDSLNDSSERTTPDGLLHLDHAYNRLVHEEQATKSEQDSCCKSGHMATSTYKHLSK